MLVRLLLAQRQDIDLIEAETGQEGLALAFSRRPDLILIDITLPDMKGGEVRRQLLANPATAPIPAIAISGNDVSETIQNSPGFQNYLAKPIDLRALTAAIDALLP